MNHKVQTGNVALSLPHGAFLLRPPRAPELHLISGPRGPCTEVVVSRMRYISAQMVERYGTKIRIVAASSPREPLFPG